MNRLSKNMMLKIISLVFALFLWSYVRSQVDPERNVVFRDINVSFENLAELKDHNLAIVSNTNLTVDIELSGKSSNIGRMNRENIYAIVDVSGYSEGEASIPIKVTVDNGDGIRVINKDPARVNVHIDEIVENEMEVSITTNGQVAENYVLGNVKASELVNVKAPSSVLDSIEKIESTVDVSGMTESTIKTGTVVAYDKDNNVVQGVSITPSSIDIEIPVLKTLTVPIRLNVTGELPEGMTVQNISIEPSSVMIRGNSAVINKITEINTSPIAIEDVLNNRALVSLVLPDGVSLFDKDIQVVASTDELVPNKFSYIFTKDEISIDNADDLDVEILTNQININFVQKNLLEDYELSKDNIEVILDLKNLNIGTYEVTPNIIVPEQFKVEKTTPEKIQVKIKKKGIF